MKTEKYFFILYLVAQFVCCTEDKDNTNSNLIQIGNSIIKPAFKNINIQFDKYIVSANQGGIFTSKHGSEIVIPKNAFTDKSGVAVTGKVDILFREFWNPLDFMLSGIPMNYDSASTNYDFESFGMFEIEAKSNGNPVFVNPNCKPIIRLNKLEDEKRVNLYFLDTIKKNWIYKGKTKYVQNKISIMQIEQNPKIEKKEIDTMSIYNHFKEKLSAIPKPNRADNSKMIFTIDVAGLDFITELKMFKNTKFEIDDSNENVNWKVLNADWEVINVKPSPIEGKYLVSFAKEKSIVTYSVVPVYIGEDYEEAIEVFKDETKKQWKNQKRISDSLVKAIEEEEIRYKLQLEKLKVQQENDVKDRIASNKIMKEFEISGFGIWNCDAPQLKNYKQVYVEFLDESGDTLSIGNGFIVNKKINGLVSFKNNELRLDFSNSISIWAILDEKLYTFSFADFKKLKFDSSTDSLVLRLKQQKINVKNYKELKTILEI